MGWFTNPTVNYVTGSGYTSLSNLLTSFPASSSLLGMYARVIDLYGSVDEILRCRFDGTNYRWVPQRESFSGTTAVSGTNISLLPLFTPPVLRLTGTLAANVSVNPTSDNAYNGQKFTVVNSMTVSTFTTTLTGLVGSNLTILGGGSRDVVYGPTGWFAAT